MPPAVNPAPSVPVPAAQLGERKRTSWLTNPWLRRMSLIMAVLLILGVILVYLYRRWEERTLLALMDPTTATSPISATASTVTQVEPMSPDAFIETEAGNLSFYFRRDVDPQVLRRFVKLAEDGFFDGMRIQSSRNGLVVNGEFGSPIAPTSMTSITPHRKGTLSIRRSKAFSDVGSVLFICLTDFPERDPNKEFVVIGEMHSGMDVAERIARKNYPFRVLRIRQR